MNNEKETQQVDPEVIGPGFDGAAGMEGVNDAENQDVNMAENGRQESQTSEKMTDEAAEWHDKYLRLSAEFDNYRKRTLKEKMDLISSASEDVIKNLLPVLDDMERALAATENATDVAAVREGVVLINNKLRDTLKVKGLAEIEALGKELDTDFHEAVAKIPCEKKLQGKIVDVVQKGYQLNDKVIRHCKVVVGDKQ